MEIYIISDSVRTSSWLRGAEMHFKFKNMVVGNSWYENS